MGGLRFSSAAGLVAGLLISGCGSGSPTSAGGGTTPAAPSIASISPARVTAGSSALTVTVNGSGFVSGSVVQVDGTAETTTFVSASQLTATVPAAQISNGAELAVAVANGSSSSSGTPISLEVDNPVPTLTSISPTSEAMGTASAAVVVTGTGFDSSTVINVNGAARPTAYSSPTQVTAVLVSSDLATAGSLSLAAVNPTPGGGSLAAMALSIGAAPAAAQITSVTPSTIAVGSANTAITVHGSGFTSNSVVEWNGTALATTVGGSASLTAMVPATNLAAAGSASVVVQTPGANPATSNGIGITIANPAPTILSIAPTSEVLGASSAVVVVTGSGFNSSTVIDVNGAPRSTAFASASRVSVTLTSADLRSAGFLTLTALNAAPGGGTSTGVTLSVAAPPPGPQISSVYPNAIYTGSPDTTITVEGSGFAANSVIEWDGTPLPTTLTAGYLSVLMATVPAADLSSAASASVTVETPGSVPPVSSAVAVTIADPPAPTVTGITPNAGPIGSASQVTVTGTGFTASTTVAVNGTSVPTTYNSATSMTANIPASSLALPGNVNVTVTTPAPGGGTSSSLPFTVYLPITANDIAYNTADGLIYASLPVTAAGEPGNMVVGIDPTTGNIRRQIQVGSNPNKLALSSDGTQLFVGLDGAASVAQVDLTQGKVVNQIPLGGGEGVYNPPLTALYLAAVPGSANSVAVATEGGGGGNSAVTIYDSGIARAHGFTSGSGPMSFGASASTLYVVAGSTVEQLTVDTTGITAATALAVLNQIPTWVQYDKGNLYLSSGKVVNAASGTLEGTFYSDASTAATGPIVSDSGLGRAFVAESPFINNNYSVLAFDESSFNLLGSIPVNGAGEGGYSTSFEKIVRWGQNGVALNANPGPFTSQSQLFIFQSPLVKDVSSTPADLSVTLSAPGTAATGASISWVATVKNLGPNAADGAAVAITLDPSLVIGSIQASVGSCGTGTSFSCDLGTLASGAGATVTVDATPTQAGTLTGTTTVTSTSDDPARDNNGSTTTTTVTGDLYGAVPAIAAIAPSLVRAGSSDFTLTVTGAGFNANSVVNLGSAALPTTLVSATQLTATVAAADVAQYGWAPVTVSNPAPGGGVSQVLPLTIYDLVNVPASGMLFDPYSQLLYATVPSTSTTVTGNSVVSINPVTGKVGTPVAVGSQPTVMTETTDGKYLYVGLSGANSLAKFDLLNQSLAATIPLSITQGGSTTSVTATGLAAMPGSDNTLAIDVSNTWGNFGIFDVSGTTGAFRPNLSAIYNGINPVFADASHVYAYDGQTSGAGFYRYTVDANGLTETDGTTLNGLGGYGGGFQLANGRVYGESGGIADPSSTPPSMVATLPLIDFYGSGSSPAGAGVAADPSLGKEFLMLENLAGTAAFGLTRYDLSTYLPESVLELPSSYSSLTSGWNMLRWGQDGLALLASAENYGTNQVTTYLVLLRGPFVAPQELGTSTAATLTGSSATTIGQGSGNTMLTLTGTNFLPGVAVTWNGSYRTTTIVDATHVTVAIPASDVATTGSASVVATNPGAAASNKLTISIQ